MGVDFMVVNTDRTRSTSLGGPSSIPAGASRPEGPSAGKPADDDPFGADFW